MQSRIWWNPTILIRVWYLKLNNTKQRSDKKKERQKERRKEEGEVSGGFLEGERGERDRPQEGLRTRERKREQERRNGKEQRLNHMENEILTTHSLQDKTQGKKNETNNRRNS